MLQYRFYLRKMEINGKIEEMVFIATENQSPNFCGNNEKVLSYKEITCEEAEKLTGMELKSKLKE